MLEGRNLSQHVEGKTLFEAITLSLEPNRTKILFGASGEGKSTLIRILAGLEEPDAGTVLLDGTPRNEIDPRTWRRRVILVPQTPHMFPGSIADNLTMAADYHGIDADVTAILEDLRIDLDPGSEARTLSGGEQKRVALGRALALNPDYLLLDEPTASLDESVRSSIDNLILTSIESGKRGVLLVTHNPREVEKFGTDGYLLSDGTLTSLEQHHLRNLEESL